MENNKQDTFILANVDEMLYFGSCLAKAVNEGSAVIFLYGPLGAGKTTLVRGFLRGLGYQEKVKSPTYTIVEPYEIAHQHIFHFDFYRLQDSKELTHIGIEEYFANPAICLIEWPEQGMPLLPKPDIACYINITNNHRELKIEAHSSRGKAILERLYP